MAAPHQGTPWLGPDANPADVARVFGFTDVPARYLQFGGPWPPPRHRRLHWLLGRWCRLCRELAEDELTGSRAAIHRRNGHIDQSGDGGPPGTTREDPAK